MFSQWRLVIKLYTFYNTHFANPVVSWSCWAMLSLLQKCSLIVFKWLWERSCHLHFSERCFWSHFVHSASVQTGEAIKCITYTTSMLVNSVSHRCSGCKLILLTCWWICKWLLYPPFLWLGCFCKDITGFAALEVAISLPVSSQRK